MTPPCPRPLRPLGRRTTRRAALGLLLLGALAPARARARAQGWVDPGPGRRQLGGREVVVSLWQQRLWAYEGDQVVFTTLVSTGTAETWETETPVGQWRVLTKLWSETMAGTVGGEPYRVEDVPHVLYFTDQGHALHGTYWHANFGTPMSHGCVNLPPDVAEWLYGWTEVGTPVTVVP